MRRIVPALLLLVATGCREGVPAFMPPERVTGDPPYALTFGFGQDADPQWSPGGDTVIYHTNAFHTMPQAPGVLLGIPFRGGAAAPVFPELNDIGRPLATPVYSPTGDRIAYMDLLSVDVAAACLRSDRLPDGTEPEPRCVTLQPLLDSAVLRVRRVGERTDPLLDPHIPVRFAGTDPGHRFGSDGPWYEQLFPFQAEHVTHYAMLFRPSWAPDGERIAFSDGLALRIWRIGEASSAVVPNTADAVSAAWSPDGAWIAFTLMERIDSTIYECACGGEGVQAFRTVYTTAPPEIVLVRPDGSERIGLGEGADAAWSADGASIYLSRAGAIVRVSLEDGAAVQIPGTGLGRAPAVSPDGAWLAFSRSKPGMTPDYDIWIVDISQ